MKALKKKLINHIAMVRDASSSMERLRLKVNEVTRKQIDLYKQAAKDTQQETRLSIYDFASEAAVKCFDVDINQVVAPHYTPHGNTNLIGTLLKVIQDFKSISTTYGDHSFLIIVQTDGEHNDGRFHSSQLKQVLDKLNDDWTLAVLVPDQKGVEYAQNCGIPVGNIQIWEVSESGLEQSYAETSVSTQSYYAARSAGIKSTKTFFNPNTNFSAKDVKANLDSLKSDAYCLFSVHKKQRIDEFVKSWMAGEYRVGSAYFQLTKPEKVQAYKQVALKEKATSKVFAGAEARTLLSLPDYEVTINPASHSKFDIFVQSTSVNRNLVPGTQLLVLK